MQYYFTAIYLVVDTKYKKIDYVNAGHPPAIFYHGNNQAIKLDVVCPPVGLFDKIDAAAQTIPYEEEGHIVMYTDGLMEVMEGSREEQMDMLDKTFRGSHYFNKEEMQTIFFDDQILQEREDDKCLVWISLK
ncbi:Phosphoserine phosphatase RsbP [compost metagenome]